METIDKSTVGSFTRSCIYMQGFTTLSDEEISQLNVGLRFTPAVCSILVIIGLVRQSPILLFVLAAIGLFAAAFARGNVVDWFYNGLIRPLFRSAALPPNPPQRRFACGIGGIFSAGAALAFLGGPPWLGYALGGFVVVASLVVATTHWCLASWMYGLIFGKPKSAVI